MVTFSADPPDFDDLVADLKTVRLKGITQLRELNLDALAAACQATGRVEPDESADAPKIEQLIRDAVDQLGTTTYELDIDDETEVLLGTSAAISFGLRPNSRGADPSALRVEAAEYWSLSLSRFRQRWEPYVIEQLAETILVLAERHRLRMARLEDQRRTPASTRLAVEWLSRFEGMYSIWTPVYALGADLSAYRSTLLAPLNKSHEATDLPAWQQDPNADQFIQAAGYITSAIYHHTEALAAVERFKIRHGGLWLLSDLDAEQAIADAVYRISWHTPNNERDDSHLRVTLDRAGHELDPFLSHLAHDEVGMAIHDEWQHWANQQCRCTWDSATTQREPFPTSRTHPGIEQRCQLHAVIAACADYCMLLDDDWLRIADWYRISGPPPKGVEGSDLYASVYHQPRPDSE